MVRGAKIHMKGRLETSKWSQNNEGKLPDWAVDILENRLEYDSGRSWTIYRVPSNIKKIHLASFNPKIISVGPFHFGKKKYKAMEEHKRRFLFRLLEILSRADITRRQVEPPPPKMFLVKLAVAMKALEQEARKCYSEHFSEISSDDFVAMMILDGCFLIMLLCLFFKNLTVPEDDPIFTIPWMLPTLQRDLVKLENQLPFFVLEKLFEIISNMTIIPEPPLLDLIVIFFNQLLPRNNPILKLNHQKKFDHMLDVFRSTFLPSVPETTSSFRPVNRFAAEILGAGIEFKKRDGQDLFDINYNNKVLEIPHFPINDNTYPMILNFVTYEQCDERTKPFFTNLILFFDSLINLPPDVLILHRNGILDHSGSSLDVAMLINHLGREIVYNLDVCHFSKHIREVNERCKAYYGSKWREWWTEVNEDYFSSPWAILSLLAAVILLLLATAQTIYTIYPYYHPR